MQELYKYLGSFGRYQFYLFLLNAVAQISSGAQLLAFTWTGYAPGSRCRVPYLDDDDNDYNRAFYSNNSQVYFAPPKDKGQLCNYCPQPIKGQNCTELDSIICDDGHIYDPQSIIPNSLTILLDLSCERVWMRQLIFSLPTVGFVIGVAIFSPLADKYGRRPILLICASTLIVFCFALPAAENYYAYAILQTIMGALNTGVYLSAYIIFMEMVDGPARALGGIWCTGIFPLGLLYLCFIAYFERNWRLIQLFIAFPTLFLIPCIWWFPESIRWLVSKGKIQEADKVIKTAASWNKVTVPQEVIDRHILKMRSSYNLESKTQGTILDLFSNFALGKNTIIVFYYWFAASLSYYGLTMNTQDLPGNPYMTFAVTAAVELPGYAISVPMLSYWGRRPTLVSFMAIGGVATLLAGVIQSEVATLFLAFLGKLCVAAAFAVAYQYSAEVFPTVCRQTGLGYSSIFARVGSISAPQIRLLGNYVAGWLPTVIYGAAPLIGAVLSIFLPETRNMHLPDSIKDSIRISSSNFRALEQEALLADEKKKKQQDDKMYGSFGLP